MIIQPTMMPPILTAMPCYRRMLTRYLVPLLVTVACVSSLSTQSKWTLQKGTVHATTRALGVAPSDYSQPASRRSFLAGVTATATATATAAATATAILTANPSPANAAMAMLTPEEFDIILRDSARSIIRVEFSGPRSDVVTVKLVDGTQFGIKGVIESPTDPRSPLKIAASCRENRVPTKFVDLDALLVGTPKKKKMYTNSRVAEAAAKNKEKKERMDQDEENRLAALYKQGQQSGQ